MESSVTLKDLEGDALLPQSLSQGQAAQSGAKDEHVRSFRRSHGGEFAGPGISRDAVQ